MTTVRELMTPDPLVVPASTSVRQGAQHLRDQDVGDVMIEEDGTLRGIVTDRDIAVRVVAEGLDPDAVTLGDACTGELRSIGPDEEIGQATRMMSEHAIRRLPVTQDGAAVGVLSLGDLAVAQDPESVLADISAASGDH